MRKPLRTRIVAVLTSAAAALAVAVITVDGNPAEAASTTQTVSWRNVCAYYYGRSWYTPSNSTSHSQTTANDNDKVAASVRIYAAGTAYNSGSGVALTGTQKLAHGGYHYSYCLWGTQKHQSTI
jgi:hypothetical protein